MYCKRIWSVARQVDLLGGSPHPRLNPRLRTHKNHLHKAGKIGELELTPESWPYSSGGRILACEEPHYATKWSRNPWRMGR
jgi:hypothetical protein